MAAAGYDKAACKKTLEAFQERGVTDGTLKLSPVKKCFTACKLNAMNSTLESSIWAKYGTKVPIDKILDTVIPDLAKYEANKTKKKEEDILNDIYKKLSEYKHEVKAVKTTAAVDRLTDASKYTGSHKERFDAEGKGKGKSGRETVADTSGYVTGYKNKDTYQK